MAACFKLELHSSYALPAPKPTPTKAGHALRLKRRTEKTTPKPRPREDLMMRLEKQRSHFSLRRASLTGRETTPEVGDVVVAGAVSAIVIVWEWVLGSD